MGFASLNPSYKRLAVAPVHRYPRVGRIMW